MINLSRAKDLVKYGLKTEKRDFSYGYYFKFNFDTMFNILPQCAALKY